jgi:hypothetical protein
MQKVFGPCADLFSAWSARSIQRMDKNTPDMVGVGETSPQPRSLDVMASLPLAVAFLRADFSAATGLGHCRFLAWCLRFVRGVL